MDNKLPENCNQCHNHCPADALRCDRGKNYFERLKNGEEAALPESENALVRLLTKCAGVAQHKSQKMREHGKNENAMFESLTAEEQARLEELLTKLQTAWKQDHERHHGGRRS